MKLDLEQLRLITKGAAEVDELLGNFSFRRFTRAQSDLYRKHRGIDSFNKSFASAGVRLAFRTDARSISFDYKFTPGSSRMYGWFDFFENGRLIDHVGGEGKLFTAGRAKVSLSEGEKTVEVYFPWSKATLLSEVELDGTTLEPISRKRTMLSFGDSITHGYDAIYPSAAYAVQTARLLDADLIDRGIGGDIFFPELFDEPDGLSPDMITIAYGTNDWNVLTRESFERGCRRFCERVCAVYPDSDIFVITPIWRADGDKETKLGMPHSELEGFMRSLLSDLPLKIIGGYALTPHDPEFYSDKYLHPNDRGFDIYARELSARISEALA